MNTVPLQIRHMARHELDATVQWAANEGWNPGLHDADLFWATDPDAFMAAELDGEMIGGGSIVSYEGVCGAMGFFIVHPQFRGRGLGRQLWIARRDRLIQRLQAPARIEMDGVFAMQNFYAKGGFEFLHRDLRFQAISPTLASARTARAKTGTVVDLSRVAFAEICHYDQSVFLAPRANFLQRWITQPDCRALGAMAHGRLVGYAVARACREGYKIGPLFANDPAIADQIFQALLSRLPNQQLQIDVPEPNLAGVKMVKSQGFTEVFGCARMALGPPLPRPVPNIFGVTTFELG